jgi:hydroxyacyl-ACP dehydratase HTD2-like protein with hotdog domain
MSELKKIIINEQTVIQKMAAVGLNYNEHARLLQILNDLPQNERITSEGQLREAYADYLQQLNDLRDTIENYQRVAAKVRSKNNNLIIENYNLHEN